MKAGIVDEESWKKASNGGWRLTMSGAGLMEDLPYEEDLEQEEEKTKFHPHAQILSLAIWHCSRESGVPVDLLEVERVSEFMENRFHQGIELPPRRSGVPDQLDGVYWPWDDIMNDAGLFGDLSCAAAECLHRTLQKAADSHLLADSGDGTTPPLLIATWWRAMQAVTALKQSLRRNLGMRHLIELHNSREEWSEQRICRDVLQAIRSAFAQIPHHRADAKPSLQGSGWMHRASALRNISEAIHPLSVRYVDGPFLRSVWVMKGLSSECKPAALSEMANPRSHLRATCPPKLDKSLPDWEALHIPNPARRLIVFTERRAWEVYEALLGVAGAG